VASGFAEVNGARLWYEEVGRGPALVLLHGHLIDSGQWDDHLPAFAGDHRVVRYDARGFGRSTPAAGPFSFSEDLRSLLAILGIERAALAGCSGGGATIVDFALTWPEMVDALVLVGSSVSGYEFTGERPAAMVEREEALARRDLNRAVELGVRLTTDGPRQPEQVDARARRRTREMMARQDERPDPALVARWADPPAVSRLTEIQAPTLVLVGEHDLAGIHAIANLVVAEVPGARREVIPDAGHHPNLEHPARFDELVLSFLREVRRGPAVRREA
jgi:pimeloyl-ACP methyl ester carboxylesterase